LEHVVSIRNNTKRYCAEAPANKVCSAIKNVAYGGTMNFYKAVFVQIILAVVSLIVSKSVFAHHSFGLYEQDPSEIAGVISDITWRNPHVHITLSVTQEGGETVNWTLEGGASYVLKRRGIEKDLFMLGSELRAAGRVHRRDQTLMLVQNVLLDTEEEILMAGGVEPRWSNETEGRDQEIKLADAAQEDQRLFRVWSIPFLRPITYGEELPYLEQPEGGRQWIERLNEYSQRCETVGMPGVMATPYPVEISDLGNSMQIRGFSNNAPFSRVIYTADSVPAVDEDTDLRMGVSIGVWQDEYNFVVKTDQISWPYFDDTNGTPQSDQMVVTENYKLSEDQTRLDYQMEVTDPTLFNDPVTVIDTYWLALNEELIHPETCAN